MTIRSLIGRLVAPVVDFVYPPVCPICHTLSDGDEKGICASCWGSFRPLGDPDAACIALRERFEQDGSVDGFIACYLFQKEGSLQEAVHLLKYRGWKSVGVRLGREVGRRLMEESGGEEIDWVVPVPLHRLKKRERGYNQSELLCEGITSITAIRTEKRLLYRSRYTQSQTALDVGERKSNVAEAFTVRPSRSPDVRGRSLLIVDDVITTGATICACASALKAAGAARVCAAAVALAEQHKNV